LSITAPIKVREARGIAVDEPGFRILVMAKVQGLYGLVVVLLLKALRCGIEDLEEV
jgi:hypothetical protein